MSCLDENDGTPCTVTNLLDPDNSQLEEYGDVHLTIGQVAVTVVFAKQKLSSNYDFIALIVENFIDGNPLDINSVPVQRLTTGFSLLLPATPETTNAVLRWHIRVRTI